jgi:hypothetical protein
MRSRPALRAPWPRRPSPTPVHPSLPGRRRAQGPSGPDRPAEGVPRRTAGPAANRLRRTRPADRRAAAGPGLVPRRRPAGGGAAARARRAGVRPQRVGRTPGGGAGDLPVALPQGRPLRAPLPGQGRPADAECPRGRLVAGDAVVLGPRRGEAPPAASQGVAGAVDDPALPLRGAAALPVGPAGRGRPAATDARPLPAGGVRARAGAAEPAVAGLLRARLGGSGRRRVGPVRGGLPRRRPRALTGNLEEAEAALTKLAAAAARARDAVAALQRRVRKAGGRG